MSRISIKSIAEAIENSAEGKKGPELERFLKDAVKFLYKRKMLSQSEKLLESLQKNIDKKYGTVKMKVRSAKKIPDIKKKELEEKMKEKYKAKEIESTYFEDKHLLGGMKIEIGEEVLDMTYRNKLNQLEKHLIQK